MRTAFLIAVLLVPLHGLAGTNLTSSVFGTAGGRTTNDVLTMVQSVGQPGGTTVSSSSGYTLSAGFLGTFSLRPGLDTDGDGVEDEMDTDNDNDGLADEAEITGSAYGGRAATDPNRPDSDGDGATDGAEAVAGSNPTDATMYLHLTDIRYDPTVGAVRIVWQANGGHTYKVYGQNDIKAGRATRTYLGTVSAIGGMGPWLTTQTNFIDATAEDTATRAYYLSLEP